MGYKAWFLILLTILPFQIMGQRSQIIVKLPAKFYNDNNPNNRKPRLVAYHNQWLYGMGFIHNAANVVKALQHIKSNKRALYSKAELVLDEEDLELAIQHCNYKDLDNALNTSLIEPWNEETKRYDLNAPYFQNDRFTASKDVAEFLETFDNNNGYLYIDFTGDSPVIQIYAGLEDFPTHKHLLPSEYLSHFYKFQEIVEHGHAAIYEDITFLNSFYKDSLDINLA